MRRLTLSPGEIERRLVELECLLLPQSPEADHMQFTIRERPQVAQLLQQFANKDRARVEK